MHLAERALAKITQGWVFIAFLLQMLKTYYFTRDGCRTFIVHFPCQKMKTFLFVWIISEKVASNETLKVRSIVCVFLFRQSFLNPCIDNPQSILFKPLLTCLTAFALQLFIFQLSHSPCFKPSISYWSYNSDTIFPTCFDPGLAVWDCNNPASFYLPVFIPVEIISRYMTINFCSLFL